MSVLLVSGCGGDKCGWPRCVHRERDAIVHVLQMDLSFETLKTAACLMHHLQCQNASLQCFVGAISQGLAGAVVLTASTLYFGTKAGRICRHID